VNELQLFISRDGKKQLENAPAALLNEFP